MQQEGVNFTERLQRLKKETLAISISKKLQIPRADNFWIRQRKKLSFSQLLPAAGMKIPLKTLWSGSFLGGDSDE